MYLSYTVFIVWFRLVVIDCFMFHFPSLAFRRFDHAKHHHVVSLALLFLNILLLLQSQDHVQAIRFDFHLATWPFLLCKLAPNGRTLGLRFRAKYTVDYLDLKA